MIDADGRVETGREPGEIGAHVRGYNIGSLGVCLVGTDAFTPAQWSALASLITDLKRQYPAARICGHSDLSPDKNGDGKITPDEYIKICPGFTVADWLAGGMQPLAGHVVS